MQRLVINYKKIHKRTHNVDTLDACSDLILILIIVLQRYHTKYFIGSRIPDPLGADMWERNNI